MSTIVIYEQVHLTDLTYVKEEECFTFPCPCGDTFTFYIV
jgi:CSL zinc finger